MKTGNLFSLPVPVLLLLSTAYAQQLPYNPTRVFLSPQNEQLAYVLQPTGTQFSLSALDISKTIDPSNLSLNTIFQNLPFLSDGTNVPLDAIIDSGGNITAYTGDCGSAGQIWKLNTQGKETGLGLWSQQSQVQGPAGVGSRYLASGVAFSSNVSARARDQKYYYFGGMCPYPGSTHSTWISNANYSNNMLSLSPSTADASLTYKTNLATTRNLPIAQAGQSLTALQPTYSNRSDGTQTQQQDFVLLGGHTQMAFMNMSQVALWSLPQEAWTYFPVTLGDSTVHTDLTVRDSIQVEPRSGHTAVLTSDGKKIIVVGGWVGNVNTPAIPQLAVLNVADSYGGTGDWTWTVPDIGSDYGLASGAGIYGHGAVMLPGDVMLVIGGYSISAPTSKFRRASGISNAYLFNVSSNSWLSSYSMPASSAGEQMSPTGPLSKTSQRAGLGIGLGIGTVAVAALLGVYVWYTRRNRKQREEREKEIQDLAFAAHRYDSDEWGMPPTMGSYSKVPITEWNGDRERAADQTHPAAPSTQRGWKSTAHETERTGLLVEVPSPTRGLRRNVSGPGRGPYPYEKRQSRNMEVIEETHGQEDRISPAEGSNLQEQTSEILKNAPNFDPFIERTGTDPLRSHPVSANSSPQAAQSVREREHEVQGWVQDWEKAAQELLHAPESAGRNSPSKSDRTISTLSDNSTHSSWSNRSGGAVTGIARTLSTRSAALLNSFANTLGGGPSPTADKPLGVLNDARSSLPSQRWRRSSSFTGAGAGASPTRRLNLSPTRSRPNTGVSSNPRNDADSFSTARTSFMQLQAEGEALLGDSHRYGPAANRPGGKSEPSSPAKEKKNSGWYGSVKRVISGAYAGGAAGGRSTSLTASSSRYDDRSSSSSPIKSQPGEDMTPRRTVSDAAFLRGKRGAKDWKAEDDEVEEPEAKGPEAAHEDDWDVERAAENRVVQLMFTVPRQRLRVVNADTDARSILSVDEKRGSLDEG